MNLSKEIDKGIGNFKHTQHMFADNGAENTEPDAIFQSLLYRALEGHKMKMPETADDWQLFNLKGQSEEAARELTRAATEVVALALQVGEASETIKNHCWRYV